MVIYSPSSRVEYSFCPRKWWLRKNGWITRTVGYPELCGMGGTAVSEAMAHFNKSIISQRKATLEECVALGLQSLVQQHAELELQERRVLGLRDSEFRDTLPKLVEVAIRTLWEADPLKGHTLIAAEHEFVEFGNARPDVISRDLMGELCVDDYKCKFSTFDEAWLDKEFEKYFDGEQRLSYSHMTNSRLFGIILVVIQPHSKRKPLKPFVIRRTSRVQDHELSLFMNDSVIDYKYMEHTLRQTNPLMVPGKAAPHADQYGDCPFRQACVEDGLDTSKMKVRYTQIMEAAK